MEMLKSVKREIWSMRIRLGLDAACWYGATAVLLSYNYPTIAALVCATGCVYLYNATKVYIRVTSELRKVMGFLQVIEDDMKTAYLYDPMNKEDDE